MKTIAILSAAGGLAGLVVFLDLARMSGPDALVAQSYRKNRTLEFRFPNVDSVSMEPELPVEVAGRSLLPAEKTVSEHLSRRPHDPAWMEARVALTLLGGDAESALNSLDREIAASPDRPTLVLYRAIALSEKAREIQREDLLAPAYDDLTRLIDSAAGLRPVALFNRAILAQKLLLFQRAIQDWRAYLEIDPSSGWAAEAHRRLSAVLSLTSNEQEFAGEGKEFSASPRSDDYPVERTIDLAMTEWLPRKLSTSARAGPELGEELTELAQTMVESHGDPWLRDLLKGPPGRVWIDATLSLSRATSLNLSGERNAAEREAQKAIEGFGRAGNAAGMLGARVEKLYALNRSLTVRACLEAASDVEPQLVKRGYAFPLARYLIEIAGCQSRSNVLPEAERNLKRAIHVARTAGYSALELRALSILANHHNVSGNSTEAWNDCWSGLNQLWTRPYGAIRGHTLYFNCSITAEHLGYPAFALALEQEASYFAGQTPNHLQAAEGFFREGLLASRVNDRAAAERAFAGGQRSLSLLPDDDVRRRYTWLFEKGLAEANLQKGDAPAALATLQQFGPAVLRAEQPHERVDYYRLRALASAAVGDQAGRYRFLSLATDETERALIGLLKEEDRIRWRVQAGSVFRPLVAATLTQPEGIRRALEIWEWYLDRSGETGASGAKWSDPDPLPFEKLKSETLISFLQLPDRVGVWVADDRGTDFEWVPGSSSELGALCRRFVKECSDSTAPEEEVRSTGKELYRALFGNLTRSLAGRELLIETDGELAAIPFEALVEPDGQYLSASHAMVYSAGFRRWARAFTGADPWTGSKALIVTAPRVRGKLARQFPPLADARYEGEMVANTFAGSTVLAGQEATVPAITARLDQTELFHFCGHGISNSDDGALLLAPTDAGEEGALLTAASLSGQKLERCRLAVLSACSSGVGESRGPVNPGSLVNGFLRAGVRNVVASRWRVDSRSTSALMRQFYGRLRATGEVGAALQYAARQIRGSPGMSHPYYWSAFSVFGE